MNRVVSFLVIVLIVSSTLLTPSQGAAEEPSPTIPHTEQTEAERIPTGPSDELVVEGVDFTNWTWTVGAGFLYWGTYCAGGAEFNFPGTLNRKTLPDGSQRQLDSVTAAECETYRMMDADQTGVYYYDIDGGHTIDYVSNSQPSNGEQTIITPSGPSEYPTLPLVVDDYFVFWAAPSGIYGTLKTGGNPLDIYHDTNIEALAVDGDYLYYTVTSEGLYRIDKYCYTTCTRELLVSVSGSSDQLLITNDKIFYLVTFTENTQTQNVLRVIPKNGPYTPQTLYTTPTNANWEIGQMVTDGTSLFWKEQYGVGIVGTEAKVRRMPITGGTVEDIVLNLTPESTEDMYRYQGYLYYKSGHDIRRVRTNAAAIMRDLEVDAWEVTQGIQSLANDVPLVAKKPTYVRVYGLHVSGPDANNVEMVLYGRTTGGVALTGSPLRPLGESRKTLTSSSNYNRAQANAGWLFKLPDHWIEEGTIQLEARIDPRNLYPDATPANNVLNGSFTFQDKAPICIRFYKVRTHSPKPRYGYPTFWPTIDVAEQMLPTDNVIAFPSQHTLEEGVWPWYSPYELPDNKTKILLNLWFHDQTTDDPDDCDDANAETHYGGVIHPEASSGWLAGNAFRDHDQFWYKMPHFSQAPVRWNSPNSTTLPHELAHNYGRQHVDCGDPDDPDTGYPYPPCQIDNVNPAGHYGFDVLTRTPIAPDAASDLLSYGFPKWISDYTWKGIYNSIDNERPAQRSLVTLNEAQRELWNVGGSVVLVSGRIDPISTTGQLEYAWQMQPASVSPRVREKWLDTAAGAYRPDTMAGANFHLRLIGANNAIIDDRAVTLFEPEHSDDEEAGFFLTFPAPAEAVERLELMADSTVLAVLDPGAATPQVSLLEPTMGQTISSTLTVRWQASDTNAADRLKYTIQYSPDDGVSWITLANDMINTDPQASATFSNVQDLPGSTQARVRVFASDGYNTSMATSELFTLHNQAPFAYIATPQAESFTPEEIVALRGGASDAEDGALPTLDMDWQIDGQYAGSGKTLNVRNYAPGQHTIEFIATDSVTNTTVATTTFSVTPLAVPARQQTPELDGSCEDTMYRSARQIELPYSQIFNMDDVTAWVTRNNDAMFVCFAGMYTSDSRTAVWVDVDGDHSGDAAPQTTDYRFRVDDEGTATVSQGNGTNFALYTTPNLYESRVLVKDNTWSAEMSIPNTMLDGTTGKIGLQLGYDYPFLLSRSSTTWPRAASISPATWGTTVLNRLPEIESLSEYQAVVGDSEKVIVVTGSGFTNGSTVLWNGTAVPTSYLSSSGLIATVSTALLSQAGQVAVTVQNDSNSDLISAPIQFMVFNPTPSITNVDPGILEPNTAGTLTINGAGFVDGSQVLWEGIELQTTFVNSTTLQATLPAELAHGNRTAILTVMNPDPVEQTSNMYAVTVDGWRIYLPAVHK